MLTLCISTAIVTNSDDCAEGGGGEGGERPYQELSNMLEHFSRFSEWREVSSLNYGDEQANSGVSSIEFD